MYKLFYYLFYTASPKDIVEIMSDLSVFVASVSAVAFAYFGYDLWKKQKISEMKSVAALKYLKTLLGFRDAINEVRNGFISIDEMSISMQEAGKKFDGSPSEEVTQTVYARRWKKLNEKRSQLQDGSYECEIFFGDDFLNVHAEMYKKINTLFVNLKMYLDGQIKDDNFEQHQEVIYDYDNSFTRELNIYFHEAKRFFDKHILFNSEYHQGEGVIL